MMTFLIHWKNYVSISSPYMYLRAGFNQQEITDTVQGHCFTCNSH